MKYIDLKTVATLHLPRVVGLEFSLRYTVYFGVDALVYIIFYYGISRYPPDSLRKDSNAMKKRIVESSE